MSKRLIPHSDQVAKWSCPYPLGSPPTTRRNRKPTKAPDPRSPYEDLKMRVAMHSSSKIIYYNNKDIFREKMMERPMPLAGANGSGIRVPACSLFQSDDVTPS